MRMTICKFRSAAAASCVLAATTGAAGAATLGDARVGFTAERTLVVDGKSYVGRMTAMPGKERHEQRIQAFEPIFLLHADNPVCVIVLAGLHTTVQFAFPPELRVLGSAGLKRKPVGKDTIDGVATVKYVIDETVSEGHATGTLWLSADDIPMKLTGKFTAKNGRTTNVRWELHHVKIGPQPAAMFEAPAGFSKLPAEAVAPLLGLRLKSAAAH